MQNIMMSNEKLVVWKKRKTVVHNCKYPKYSTYAQEKVNQLIRSMFTFKNKL